MNIAYETDKQLSIYDRSLHSGWFTVTRYYDVIKPLIVYMEGLHAHAEVEIMYVAEGKGLITMESEEITLRRGDFIFLDSLVPHMLTMEENIPYHILNIEAVLSSGKNSAVNIDILMEDERFSSFISDRLPVFTCRDDENAVYSGICNLHRLLQYRAAPVGIDLQLSCILIEIARQHHYNSNNRTLGTYAYVKRALRFIAENYDRDIGVDDVAEAAMISKSHLQRVFHQLEGVTIIEKINGFRLEKAKYLLKNSTLPIVEIAVDVGFSSRQYFTGLFTRAVGCSPAHYRKRNIDDIIVMGHVTLNEELSRRKALS